jgi:hypothetical protein
MEFLHNFAFSYYFLASGALIEIPPSAFDVSFGSGQRLYFAKSVLPELLLVVKSKKDLRRTTSRKIPTAQEMGPKWGLATYCRQASLLSNDPQHIKVLVLLFPTTAQRSKPAKL